MDSGLTPYSVILPVFAVEPGPDDFKVLQIVGTCSYLGSNVFLTAGHVVAALGETDRGAIQVIDPSTGESHALEIDAYDSLHPDIGVIVSEVPRSMSGWVRPLHWSTAQLGHFDRVRVYGYPYGLQRDRDGNEAYSVIRGFEGYVVSALEKHLPVALPPPAFHMYEVSFAVPKGLSGAPLLDARDLDRVQAAGIVIGNSESSMEVHRSTDLETEQVEGTLKRVERTMERHESLTLGMAIRTSWLVSVKSPLLNMTLGEHLDRESLLLPPGHQGALESAP